MNTNINKNSIYELPFDEVMNLYKLKEKAEVENDIKLRTKLLAQYPELFVPETYAEIKSAFENAVKYNTNKETAATADKSSAPKLKK